MSEPDVTIDGERIMNPYSEQCTLCAHYDFETDSCPAFPKEKIPIDIWMDRVKHTKPVKGQGNSIVYEPQRRGA